jgi:2-oxoglutarate dehydrogenase E2 component (dihydrolipoamide succinyltransferase)
MAIDLKVPTVGESITEGTITRWFKKDGEILRNMEPAFELETEKATTEVPAPAGGVLRILVPEGSTVAIGALVGRLEPAPEGAKSSSPSQPKSDPPVAVSTQPMPDKDRAAAAKPSADGARTSPATADPRQVLLSPAAKHLAEAAAVDPGQVQGTGPSGRVLKEDVVRHLEEQKTAVTAPPTDKPPAPAFQYPTSSPQRETRKRMSPIRQRIGERLLKAQQTAAILTTFNEVDMSAILDLRQRFKDAFKTKYGVGLGFMSFFVKATVEALRAFPIVNARIDGADVVYSEDFHIGVAVSTDRGLMVPVVRSAQNSSFAAIEKTVAALAVKARDGKIGVDDLQGGTFTITNGGVFGSLLSTPILNPPQSAILGMHTIQKRAIVVDDQIVIRPMMYLAVSYDHRLIDGREAVQFLVRIKDCLESPERLLLEV